MTCIYVLKPNVKIIPTESLAICEKKVHLLKHDELQILVKLAKRPLFPSDLNVLRSTLQQKLLQTLNIKVKKRQLMRLLATEYRTTSKSKAQSLKLTALGKVTLFWDRNGLSLPPGQYLINSYLPDSIEGKHRASYLIDQHPVRMRDQWIIKQIKKCKERNILELGCGKEQRLYKQIIRSCPDVNYTGIDKNIRSEGNLIKSNFLRYPHVIPKSTLVVAEEVIEHLHEKSILPLIMDLASKGVHTFILTTPNADFNRYLNNQIRHPGHRFEWGRSDLIGWINELKSALKCRVRTTQIGKLIKGTGPTWGIVIRISLKKS